MVERMRIPLPFFLFSILSCASATRSPAQVNEVDQLPSCARIKYAYSSPRVPVSELPQNYARQALAEAKQVWTAGKILGRDTSGACAPVEFRDLLEKPAWCRTNEYSGPYLDPRVFAAYARMSRDDFASFQNCWQ